MWRSSQEGDDCGSHVSAVITAGLVIFFLGSRGYDQTPDRWTSGRWLGTSWVHPWTFQAVKDHIVNIGYSRGRLSDSALATCAGYSFDLPRQGLHFRLIADICVGNLPNTSTRGLSHILHSGPLEETRLSLYRW